MKDGRFRLDIRKTSLLLECFLFIRFPREVVDAPSLEATEVRLDWSWNNLIQVLSWEGRIETLSSLNVSSNPEYETVSLPLMLSTIIPII